MYDLIRSSGKEIDQVNTSASAEMSNGLRTIVGKILTTGILLDAGDKAREYAAYCDGMSDYFNAEKEGVEEKSFVCAYNTNNATTTKVHTSRDNGGMKGNIWTLSHLSLKDMMTPHPNAMYDVEIEKIIELDPDVIILCLWNVAGISTPPSEVEATLEERAEYFKETTAYKEGRIYGINYEAYGSYIGIGGLGVLASYIWPDVYDEAKGWELMEECIDKFTDIKMNVKDCGGLIPYKVNTTS